MRTTTTPGYQPLKERPLSGHQQLLALVPDGSRVLDVGCSTGYLARPLVERGCAVVGIELDEAAAAVARDVCEEVLVGTSRSSSCRFRARPSTSSSAATWSSTCATLIASSERMRPLLRDDGRLVLTTPNVANWTIRLGLLFGRWRYTERGILDRTHAHLFTRKTLTEALAATGCRITDCDYTVPVPVIRTAGIESVAHAIGRVRPSLFAYQFVVAATPA